MMDKAGRITAMMSASIPMDLFMSKFMGLARDMASEREILRGCAVQGLLEPWTDRMGGSEDYIRVSDIIATPDFGAEKAAQLMLEYGVEKLYFDRITTEILKSLMESRESSELGVHMGGNPGNECDFTYEFAYVPDGFCGLSVVANFSISMEKHHTSMSIKYPCTIP